MRARAAAWRSGAPQAAGRRGHGRTILSRGWCSPTDAKPKGNEVELYNYLAAVLGQSKTVIEKLRTYNAVGGVIAKVGSGVRSETQGSVC